MQPKTLICLPFFLLISLLALGCSILPSQNKQTDAGGIYKSYDRGATWENKSYVIPKKQDNKIIGQTDLTNTSAVYMINDYRDQRLIYLGTKEQGIFRTENGGDSWAQIINSGYVGGIALDPTATSTIYATVNNQVVKSTNYGQNWRVLYTEGRANVLMTTIAIDPFEPNILYAGSSWGELIKSEDYGVNWKIIKNCGGYIKKIIVNLNDSNIVYAATGQVGIFRTDDKGETWKNILFHLWSTKEKQKRYQGAAILHDTVLDPGQKDTLVVATDYSLFTIENEGVLWTKIDLVTPPKEKHIYSLVVDPQNSDIIYYGTNSTFHRSEDGGKTWAGLRLPSPKAVTALLIDKNTPNILYIGTRLIVEEKTNR